MRNKKKNVDLKGIRTNVNKKKSNYKDEIEK
jgi:hypothetical protein